MKTYYAQKCPRGFANEVTVYRFTSRLGRDRFVEVMDGATVASAADARKLTGWRGDAATENFCRLVDGDRELEYVEGAK